MRSNDADNEVGDFGTAGQRHVDSCTAACGRAEDGQTSCVNTEHANKLHNALSDRHVTTWSPTTAAPRQTELLPSSAASSQCVAVVRSRAVTARSSLTAAPEGVRRAGS